MSSKGRGRAQKNQSNLSAVVSHALFGALARLNHVCEGDEFGRADRCEVGGMTEENLPFATIGGRGMNLPLR